MFLLLWRASMAPLWSAIHWPLGGGLFYWLKWKRWPLWVTNTNWKPCLGGMGWSRAIHKCQSGGQDDWFLTSSIGDSAGFKLPACRMVIGGDCDSSASEMQEITIHSSWICLLVHDPYRNVRISFDICRESLGLFRCHPLQACMRVGNGVRWDLRPLSVYKWGQESIPPCLHSYPLNTLRFDSMCDQGSGWWKGTTTWESASWAWSLFLYSMGEWGVWGSNGIINSFFGSLPCSSPQKWQIKWSCMLSWMGHDSSMAYLHNTWITFAKG